MIYQLGQLLAESAKRTPEAIAVSSSGETLTYAQLDEQASRLAALLASAGVVRGNRVGFALPKSIASIVAIFGILKAGGVYVPIDAASPKGRFAYIVRNCGIRHLITRPDLARALADALGDTAAQELDLVLLADGETSAAADGALGTAFGGAIRGWADIAGQPLHPADTGGCETDLAYVLYTSGSTGAPKGVMITHQASLTFVNWTYDRFAVTERDVISSHAPLHFDLSIFDIFTAVKAGARIVLVPERLSTFPVRLAEFIRDERISIWYSVPSALTLMLERGNFADHRYPDLRVILFAGEVFPIKFLQALMRATPAGLFNLYGPTETNVCTYYEVRPADLERTTPVPIGVPIANYDVFAVNEAGQRIGRGGEKGELWGRGPGLMSGYWGDAEKTNRTLRPNPFLPHLPNDRIFATGDIVSLDDDGNFIYHGRRDNMVKSRGYRIELGEIEAALYRHPQVREAVVIPVPDPLLTNRLRAVLVLEREGAVSVDELREFCRAELPRYMIPDALELRADLPKTSTGKIDRQALAAEREGAAPV
jgi:amino acid adenylation domain-containing protein